MSIDSHASAGVEPLCRTVASPAPGARIIRPVASPARLSLERLAGSMDDLSGEILVEVRRRVEGLAQVERKLDDRIRARLQAAEEEAMRRLDRAAEESAQLRRRAEVEAKEKALRLEKEGRAGGFREGFARGRDEGYRLGLEEGRRDGQREGHDESSRRLESELAPAIRAFGEAARLLAEESQRLIAEAREGLLHLALEVARKLVKREVLAADDAAVRNVEHAIDLIFRRGSLVIQVHPADVPLVEKALAASPRWGEGFDAIDVRPSPEMERGGCRLLSGAGVCDMSLETQLALIEEALLKGLRDQRAVAVEPAQPRSGQEAAS